MYVIPTTLYIVKTRTRSESGCAHAEHRRRRCPAPRNSKHPSRSSCRPTRLGRRGDGHAFVTFRPPHSQRCPGAFSGVCVCRIFRVDSRSGFDPFFLPLTEGFNKSHFALAVGPRVLELRHIPVQAGSGRRPAATRRDKGTARTKDQPGSEPALRQSSVRANERTVLDRILLSHLQSMAPVNVSAPAAAQDASAQPMVNEEWNPAPPSSYITCTIAQKDTSVVLVDEEWNPAPPSSYITCTIA